VIEVLKKKGRPQTLSSTGRREVRIKNESSAPPNRKKGSHRCGIQRYRKGTMNGKGRTPQIFEEKYRRGAWGAPGRPADMELKQWVSSRKRKEAKKMCFGRFLEKGVTQSRKKHQCQRPGIKLDRGGKGDKKRDPWDTTSSGSKTRRQPRGGKRKHV